MIFSTKRLIRVAVLLSIVCALFCLCYIDNNIGCYDQFIVNDIEYKTIISERLGKDYYFGDIYFDGEKLFFDHSNNFFLYSLLPETERGYNPEVEIKADNDDVKIAFLREKLSDEIMSQNTGIKFVVYDDNYFYESELRCTSLPIMAINTQSDIPDSKDVSVAASMSLFDNEARGSSRLKSSEGFIHIRGATAIFYPKKSYKLSLTKTAKDGVEGKNKLSLLGMRADDD